MDPTENLISRVKRRIRSSQFKGKDEDRTQNHSASGESSQSVDTSTSVNSPSKGEGKESENDSLIIIPDTPSPIFSRFAGKRGKLFHGNKFSQCNNDKRKTNDIPDNKLTTEDKASVVEKIPSDNVSCSRVGSSRESSELAEKPSSPWKNSFISNPGKHFADLSPHKSASKYKSKFLGSKVTLSPGKVKISPYVPSHGGHFKTALQEMMERNQMRSMSSSGIIHEDSERKLPHNHCVNHPESSGASLDQGCKRKKSKKILSSPTSVCSKQLCNKTPSKQRNIDSKYPSLLDSECNNGRKRSEKLSTLPEQLKRPRLDHGFDFYSGTGHGWPSESSDSEEDSEFEPCDSQTLQAMLDEGVKTRNTNPVEPASGDKTMLDKVPHEYHSDKQTKTDSAVSSDVPFLHDMASSRSDNCNPQGQNQRIHALEANSWCSPSNSWCSPSKHSHATKSRFDFRNKTSKKFEDGFSKQSQSHWSTTSRQESKSHSKKMAAERSIAVPLAASEFRSNNHRLSHPSPKDSSHQPVQSRHHGSCADKPVTCDLESSTPVRLVEQVAGDEEYAKKLQEEMDMEFAMSLQNLENQPPVFEEPAISPHELPGHAAGLYNRGLAASAQGRWTAAQRGRISTRYPDLDEVEALLHDLDEPEERLLQHSSQSQVTTRTGARSHRGQHFLDDIARINNSLLSVLESNSPPQARHSRSRRRGQRRNNVHFSFSISSPGEDGNDYEDLLNLAEMLGDVKKKGLTDAQRSRLPVRQYQGNGDKQEAEECLVCMCEYAQNESLKMLPCFHEFHEQCIDKWIKNNASCPVCRVEVKLT